MKCNECGNEIQPGQTFCPKCGARVDSEKVMGNVAQSGIQDQPSIPFKKKIILIAGIFIDYFVCCRLIGGLLGLILLIFVLVVSPYLYQTALKVPAKIIKEFLLQVGLFLVVILFLVHGIGKDRQYSRWEIEDNGSDARSVPQRIHDVLTGSPELHSRLISNDHPQMDGFVEGYGFNPMDAIDRDTFIKEAISPSFKDLRSKVEDYKGTAIKVKGLIIGKYIPEDYMEGITELGIDANEFNELLDRYCGYTCLNDNTEVAGGYVVITADSSAYPNEWRVIYGYPVGVNKDGDIIIWGEFFSDEGEETANAGQANLESSPVSIDVIEEEKNTGYILSDSDSRYISENEIALLDKGTLRIARNEIYARHGRKFETEDLNRYFIAQPWYSGYLSADEFDESILNEYERANLDLIKSVEGKGTDPLKPEYITGNSNQLGVLDIANKQYLSANGSKLMEIWGGDSDGISVGFYSGEEYVWEGTVTRYQVLSNGGLGVVVEGVYLVTGESDYLEIEWGSMGEVNSPNVVHENDYEGLGGAYSAL